MALFYLSAAFIAGVLSGALASWPSAAGLPPAALALALATLLAFLPARGGAARVGSPATSYRVPLLCLAFFGLGIARNPTVSTSPPALARLIGQTATVVAVVRGDPIAGVHTAHYTALLESVLHRTASSPISGTLGIQVSNAVSLQDGDRLSLTGRLLRPFLAPGLLGGPSHGLGVDAEMRFPRLRVIGRDNSLRSVSASLRDGIAQGIDRWLPEPEASLLVALTVGGHTSSIGSLTQPFIRTGLIHAVAISGIKVALVAGILLELAALVRRRRLGYLLAAFGIAGYVVMTGATASGIRSGLMWGAVCLAAILGRRTVAAVSLSVVVALMLAQDPHLLWSLAFLMSAMGTAGIVLFASPLDRFLHRLYLPSPFRQALAVTLVAQLSTLALTAAGFHVLALSGPISNTYFLPAMPFLILCGFALGVAAAVPALAAPIAALAYALLHVLILFTVTLSHVPLAIPPPLSGPLAACLYYLLILAASVAAVRTFGWVRPTQPISSRREIAGAVGGSALALSTLLVPHSSAPASFSYLGTGNSYLARSSHRVILLDGAPSTRSLLERLGAALAPTDRILDLLVLSDPRSGNVASLLEVVNRYHVSAVLDPGMEYPTRTYAAFRAALRAQHIPDYALRPGTSLDLPPLHVQALAPVGPCPSPLNCAGVVRIDSSHASVLYLGVASPVEEAEIPFLNPTHRLTAVVTNSGSPLPPQLLTWLGPTPVFHSPAPLIPLGP